MAKSKTPTTILRRQTFRCFAIIVLISVLAFSGLLYTYYRHRSKDILAEATQKEQTFLNLLSPFLEERVNAKDPTGVGSLLSEHSNGSQGDIFLLDSDSSWICPPVKMFKPLSSNEGELQQVTFGTTFPDAWEKISSQQEDHFLDKRGLYVFTTLTPFSKQQKTCPERAESEKEGDEAFDRSHSPLKLVSFVPREELAAHWKRLQMDLVVLVLVLLVISPAPMWLLASIIVKRKHYQQKLWCVANYDPLTGVYNRSMFTDKLEYLLTQAERYGHQFALLVVNLDDFRSVNNSLGHQAGDLLLQEAAARIADTLRKSDVISRLGGDEFAIILPEIARIEVVEGVAKRIMYTLADPFSLQGTEKALSASIGVALFPEDGTDAEALLKHAERALYYAKEQGGNNYTLFRALWRMSRD